MSKITDVVTELVLPITEEVGVSLWDVEYVRTGSETTSGYSLTMKTACQSINARQSKALDPLLDDVDILNDSFILELRLQASNVH